MTGLAYKWNATGMQYNYCDDAVKFLSFRLEGLTEVLLEWHATWPLVLQPCQPVHGRGRGRAGAAAFATS